MFCHWSQESTENILSIVKQRTGSFGDRPARPTLLEQVLNQKRLSLLRSPEVVQFLQKQQQLLNQQVLEQRQQQFPGAPVWGLTTKSAVLCLTVMDRCAFRPRDALITRHWWCTPGSPELGKLSQEDPKFKASLGYIASSFLKKERERERDRKTTFLLSVRVHLRINQYWVFAFPCVIPLWVWESLLYHL